MRKSPIPHLGARLGTTRDASPILGVTDGQTRLLARTGELPVAYTLPNGFRLFDLKIVARVARHRVRGNRRPRPPVPPQDLHETTRVAPDRERKRRHQAATAIGDHADGAA